MFYRLRVGTQEGIERGHQWRELTESEFVAIVQGQRPLADSEAQSRDSTVFDTAAQNRVMHYLAAWHRVTNAWQTDLDVTQAQQAWQSGDFAHDKAGT
jgi:hypothetical protein